MPQLPKFLNRQMRWKFPIWWDKMTNSSIIPAPGFPFILCKSQINISDSDWCHTIKNKILLYFVNHLGSNYIGE
ncbi:hypothetical protein Ae201684P_005498 [Aphanomyces euteiches]|nr:hypothetical protein Ae201684P_005498 [Aphanomyces euteiches]